MKKLKDVLRLKCVGHLSHRQIASALSLSASTVSYYVRAAQAAGVDWQRASEMSEEALQNIVYPHCKQLMSTPAKTKYPLPDFTKVNQELKRKGVTLHLLWQEYQDLQKNKGYSYAQFCRYYNKFCKTIEPAFVHTYKSGEKCFIDYCGPRIPLYAEDGSIAHEVYIFVAVLAASNYTFVIASLTRSLPDWIDAHVQALEYFGGVPLLLIPDNEKAGVKDACYYDPDVNPTYADFAEHYQAIVLPTRPVQPRDKGKVEKAVQCAETFIIAKLRHHHFYSLTELNTAIRPLLDEFNRQPFQKLEGTRHSQFIKIDKPYLLPLPAQRYEYATFKKAVVGLNYHVQINKNFYSVPHCFMKKTVMCRITQQLITIYHDNKLIACHAHSNGSGTYTTLTEHMPDVHKRHQAWTPELFLQWANTIGEAMLQIAQQNIAVQPHPECIYRIHNGFRQLAKQYSPKRLHGACQYALAHDMYRHRNVRAVLAAKLDQQTLLAANDAVLQSTQNHEHIRGPEYFN